MSKAHAAETPTHLEQIKIEVDLPVTYFEALQYLAAKHQVEMQDLVMEAIATATQSIS